MNGNVLIGATQLCPSQLVSCILWLS